ncbi:hypothetical protein HYH03_016203 [Edaphochlamys debaryana]|uniref:Protein kinase domain-containing protein n=1 Tax=Edaphochlamys debaryana TaxID=47281 RepID=A0A835XS27_9CHLO|nr:hypothetical protein HYH03_016203 [Edaphochlamys debaryana]|eukprot:KAG2484999.1 hypothetical protein HYH03_016203 [Edaphochlamys debaryana]
MPHGSPGLAAELLNLPGQNVMITRAGVPQPGTSLMQRAVLTKAPAVFRYEKEGSAAALDASANLANGKPGPTHIARGSTLPVDCAGDHSALGSTTFAALPLYSGERLLGLMWVASGGGSAAGHAPCTSPLFSDTELGRASNMALLRQVSSAVSVCLAGAVDPDYVNWLAGLLRRLAAAATLQALVGELCEAMAQHVRRRFLVDTIAHASVVPDPNGSVGFMLDHRPGPGGPVGARWGAGQGPMGAPASSRQASITSPPPGVGGGAAGLGAGAAASAGRSTTGTSPARRSDSFTNRAGRGGGGPQRTSSHAARGAGGGGRRSMGLAEQAAARAHATAASPANTGGASAATDPHGFQRQGSASPVPSAGEGPATTPPPPPMVAVPSLRAKGFQLSHTLLQRMVTVVDGRGPEGVYAGLAVADCGRHVQDVHQPSRDVCMLMAGGVRGADMAGDASDSNLFASERSTGRILMQSLVLLGLEIGAPLPYQLPVHCAGAAATRSGGDPTGGGGVQGTGSVLALYLAFPCRLPPLLINSAHTSSRQLLAVMLARLVRRKVSGDLAAEFTTLCSGVPGSYAVVTSLGMGAPSAATNGKGEEFSRQTSGQLESALPPAGARAFGTPLEPSIGSMGYQRLVPLPAGSIGANPALLAAFTDLGSSVAAASIGKRIPDPSAGSTAPIGPAPPANGPLVASLVQAGGPGPAPAPAAAAPAVAEAGEEEEPHEADEADVMLSSDPRFELEGEGAEGGGGAVGDRFSDGGSVGAADASVRTAAPQALAPPAAVLTVSEADATSSMRHHMGLLVESIMSSLRTTSQLDDPFDPGALASTRRSLDLELEDLRLSGVLGDGGSGVVLCGMLATVPVAVKIIQMPEVDQLLLSAPVRNLANPAAAAGGPNGAIVPAGGGKGGAMANGQPAANGQAAPGNGQPPGGANGQPAPAKGASNSSSKLHQAQRDMLRNAMELAVMRSISHVNIIQVYAVYDNVVLERIKREGGQTAYALRRQVLQDMQPEKAGSKPVFVALCMELCDSGSLASKLEERSFPRYLPAPAAAGLPVGDGSLGANGAAAVARPGRILDMMGVYLTVLEMACALRYLHARRLMHRDIKSANILLKASPTDPRGWTCKLADFGSCIVLDQFQPHDESGGGGGAGGGGMVGDMSQGKAVGGRWYAVQEQSWGTITHMSPESMDNNSKVDASSDIFALGVVMWEIASGRGYRPYKELAPEQIGAAVKAGLRPVFTAEVPAPYKQLAQQCWSADPAKRPTAVQVVAQIKQQLGLLQSEARSQVQAQVQVQRPPAAAKPVA